MTDRHRRRLPDFDDLGAVERYAQETGVDLGWYVLDDDHVPRRATMTEWGAWREDFSRSIVAKDRIGDVEVSTVFLGLDHGYSGGPPVLFETMIFGGPMTHYQWRYRTWERAAAWHALVVEAIRAGRVLDDD